MRKPMRGYATFFRECWRTFQTTGAVAPSGPWLAKQLVAGIAEASGPERILEAGPGTGAVTREIVRRMRAGDTLHLVELNERFVEVLRQRFAEEEDFVRVADRTRIFPMAAQDLQANGLYDHVVCGIPFNNFTPELVDAILRRLVEVLREGGTLRFFEYLWVRPVRQWSLSANERRRVAGVGAVLQSYIDRYEVRRDHVYWNVLPAAAHRLLIRNGGEAKDGHASADG